MYNPVSKWILINEFERYVGIELSWYVEFLIGLFNNLFSTST